MKAFPQHELVGSVLPGTPVFSLSQVRSKLGAGREVDRGRVQLLLRRYLEAGLHFRGLECDAEGVYGNTIYATVSASNSTTGGIAPKVSETAWCRLWSCTEGGRAVG